MRGRRLGSLPPFDPQQTALLTMPGHCPGAPLLFKALADTWEEPAPPFEDYEAAYESADLGGNPVAVEDCAALDFEPTIEIGPTTNLTDSPSGLDFALHQPQDNDLDSRATASLRDATVTLPAGMAVNPSQAAGLGVCSEEQIGFLEADAEGMLRFSKAPQSCPDAAKIGTMEVSSPALVRRNAKQEVEKDPRRRADPGSAQRLRLHRPALRQPLRLADRRLPGDRRREDRDRRQARRRRPAEPCHRPGHHPL